MSTEDMDGSDQEDFDLVIGEQGFKFTDRVPPFAPGDTEEIDNDDEGGSLRVTLLDTGVAAVSLMQYGEVLDAEVVDVPENFGEVTFDDSDA